MPRHYIRKTTRGLQYTKEQLLEAVQKIKSGEYNGYQAAILYNIPRTTLNDRVTGKHGVKSQSLGKPPIFSPSFEKTLATNLNTLQDHGFALTKKEILELVGSYAKRNKKKMPSKSGMPGECWLSAFAKRHDFSIKPLYAEFGSKDKEVIIVKEFYSLIESKINELDLIDKPGHIWHIEEHSFSNGKRVANTDREKDFTVVTACSANGAKAPLLTVFKGQESREWMLGKHINVSHKGGICREVFTNYFTTILNYIDDSLPNLIIYDGLNSHMDIGLVDDARRANITVIKSPDLDALDLPIARTLKLKWSSEAETFAGTSKEFANVVANVFDNAEVFEIEEGFKSAGVYPFATVCDSKFDTDRLKEYEEYKVFKTSQLMFKANHAENVIENQRTLVRELEETPERIKTEVEAIYVPGDMVPPKIYTRQNKNARIAVKKGLTNKDSGENHQLTKPEADQLIAWIMNLNNTGFSITEDKVADGVYNLVTDSETAPNKMPNGDWYDSFLKGHPEVADVISIQRTDETVEAWYKRVKNCLERKELEHVLDYPKRVFNCREVAFCLHPKENEANDKTINDEDLTVYVTANAKGDILPPSVIFPFKTGFMSQNGFGRSLSSWTRAEFFNDYLTDVFYPWLIEKKVEFPVILLLDHTAHLNLRISEFCNQKQIILVALPNYIQPLERFFRQFKQYWIDEVTVMQKLRKDEIGKEFESYLKKDFGMEIRTGFLNCGFSHNLCKI